MNPTTRKRITRGVAAALAVLVAGVVAVVVAVATAGVRLDAAFLRERLAAELARASGRHVAIDGPVVLEVSARPSLSVRGLRVDDPPGFGAGATLAVGEVRFSIDAWAWLREHRLHLREARASGARLRLVQRADGRVNWAFDAAAGAPADAAAPARAADSPSPPAGARPAQDAAAAPSPSLAIDRLELRDVEIEVSRADGPVHVLALASLDAQAPSGGPARLSARGAIDRRVPFELSATAGAISALLAPPGGGARAWPLELTVGVLGTTLRAEGTLERGAAGPSGRLAFGLGTPDLEELERALGVELPKVGAAALAGTISFAPGTVELASLVGSMGRTSLAGDLRVDLGGARPRVSGRLTLPALDMGPFLEIDASQRAPRARTLAQWYRETAQAKLRLAALAAFDADLELHVERWLSLPGDVGDARLGVRLDAGRLEAPLAVDVAGVHLTGDLRADASAPTPSFELGVGARDSPLGGLAELLLGVRGLQGALGGFALRATGQGERVGDLLKSLDVRMVVTRGGLTYGNAGADGAAPAGGSPVAFGLDVFELTIPAGGALSVRAAGSLLEQPLTASVSGATLQALMHGPAPIVAHAASRSVRARVEGTVAEPGPGRGSELSISLSADRASDVASWLKLRGGANLPLAFEGRASWHANAWTLDAGRIRVGRNAMSAHLERGPADAARPGGRALMRLSLSAESIDLDELDALLPRGGAPEGRPLLELPILPEGLDLSDTDVHVDVRRVVGSQLDAADLRFDARMRDGRMLASPFSAVLLGVPFGGAVALDLRAAPSAELWLSADDADVGQALRRLKLAENVDATVGRLVVHAQARGARLGDLLARADVLAELTGGRLVVRDRNTGAQARVAIERGQARADAGAPLSARLEGRLDDEPLTLELKTGTLVELARPDRRVEFDVDARLAQAHARLVGSLARPMSDRELEFALDVGGERLDALSRVARVALPPWGPYSLIGRLRIGRGGYEVSNLRLRVGASVLRGGGRLDTTQRPPRVDVTLEAPDVQLDDFALRGWWPFERADADEHDAALDVAALRERAARASGRAEQLLSREVLARQDATVVVQVGRVRSGTDVLGRGWFVARVDGGRADIGPVQVDVPGGRASLWLGYAPGARDVDTYLRIQAERFDYGVLARRIAPGSDLAGSFDLDVDLKSRAPSLARVMATGNGSVDFSVRPVNLRAGVFDLWAANLFVALATRVDPSSASAVNCGIGRFTLADGVLTSRQILLDTTRVRVLGEGRADFRDESLAMTFAPHPKRAQFFSLATPVTVGGSFEAPSIGVSAGDVLATIARLATSLVWVPLQSLVGREVPADGADVCARAAPAR